MYLIVSNLAAVVKYSSLLISSYPMRSSLPEMPAIRLLMVGSNAMSTCPFTGERCSLVASVVDGVS